jgi:hypothetical protein
MSISCRGHDNVLVLDSCAVPVNEMFESLINYRNIKDITKRYPVSIDEIFECADACMDMSPLTQEDFIEFDCAPVKGTNPEDEEFSLNTVSVSDHLFISIIIHARTFYPELDDIDKLYTDGLYLILAECVQDVSDGQEYFKHSDLHRLVFQAFEQAFPLNIMEAIEKLVKTFTSAQSREAHNHD